MNHWFRWNKTLSPQKPKPLAAARLVLSIFSLYHSFRVSHLFDLGLKPSLSLIQIQIHFWGFLFLEFIRRKNEISSLIPIWLPLQIPRIVSFFVFSSIILNLLLFFFIYFHQPLIRSNWFRFFVLFVLNFFCLKFFIEINFIELNLGFGIWFFCWILLFCVSCELQFCVLLFSFTLLFLQKQLNCCRSSH